ncbi:bone marrow stromal antigen 2 [Equus asinus]|uniref:Bone marrow stromal antigen 2 n=1 Tax=Equus asinus TaxID=9793 RepID=A0A8C4L050_EQUAS|nr:bone marrow stromal antigen 2 [Equus asinus]XP_044629922.1 bone marrow stromal antigen 2 [Equus asinus]XP_044629932.1 bone marrow stromal antigen 2 [Equus asinus]XP_044629942.1 bone marrow stromal antigen 2 [Equus asinus]
MLTRGGPQKLPASAPNSCPDSHIQGQIWLALTSYHNWPVPMGDHRLLRWLLLVVVVVVFLLVTTIIFAVQANSKACKDGLRAEQECRNGTHFLEHQLRRAQEVLQGTETQAAICNQTVVTLRASLEMAKADSREQLSRVQELEGETAALKQQLQNALAEVERLRQRNDGASGGNNDPASSANALSPLVAAVFLPLGLWDLQA